MRLFIVDQRNAFKGTLEASDSRKLIQNEYCTESQDLLKRLNEQKKRVRCQCGVIMHSVFNSNARNYFLRRNPSQTRTHMRQCPFWSFSLYQSVTQKRQDSICAGSTDVFLINTRSRPENSHQNSYAKKHLPKSKDLIFSDDKPRNKRMFSYLYGMFEQMGINRYPNNILHRKAVWDDIYYYLQKSKYKDLFWCPSTHCRGGAVQLNQKIIKNWTDKNRVNHGLLLGIIDEIPLGRKLFIKKWENDPYPIKCDLNSNNKSVIGESGPYFALAVCLPQGKANDKYVIPKIEKITLQSIKSWKSWMPMERDFYRKITNCLFVNNIPFIKPLTSIDRELKPVFVLPHKAVLVLETQNTYIYERTFKLPVFEISEKKLDSTINVLQSI